MTEQEFQDKKLEQLAQKGLLLSADELDMNDVEAQLDARVDALLNKKQTIGRRINWMAMAAGFLILCVAGYFLLSPNNNQNLYAQFFEPYPNNIRQQSRGGEQTMDILERSATAYDTGQYDEMISLFSNVPDKSLIVTNTIYLAIAYLETDRTNDAIDLLSTNADLLPENQLSACQYYLGLAYLKSKNNQRAAETFNKIKPQDSFYYEKVQRILKSIGGQ